MNCKELQNRRISIPTTATTKRYVPIIDVVDLIEDNPLEVTDNVTSVVKHRPQNFCSHDEAGGFLIDLNVSRDKTYVLEGRLKVPEFLIG